MRKIPVIFLLIYSLTGCLTVLGPDLSARHEVADCVMDNLGDCREDKNILSYRILGYGPTDADAKKAAYLYLDKKFPGRKILAEHWIRDYEPIFGMPITPYVILLEGGAK